MVFLVVILCREPTGGAFNKVTPKTPSDSILLATAEFKQAAKAAPLNFVISLLQTQLVKSMKLCWAREADIGNRNKEEYWDTYGSLGWDWPFFTNARRHLIMNRRNLTTYLATLDQPQYGDGTPMHTLLSDYSTAIDRHESLLKDWQDERQCYYSHKGLEGAKRSVQSAERVRS